LTQVVEVPDRILPRVLGLTRETRETRLLLLLVISAAVVILAGVTLIGRREFDLARAVFWIGITLVAAALPVRVPGGLHATITTAPVLAAIFDPQLANPFAVCWVAFLGTFEPRDLRGELPWYGTLYNRSNWVITAFMAWAAFDLVAASTIPEDPTGALWALAVVGGVFFIVNSVLSLLAAAARTQTPIRRIWSLSISKISVGLISQVPLGWLMAEIAHKVGAWATLLFMVPLLLARFSFTKYTELRDLFYGSVSALSQAIDAKDGFTRGHADRVSRIAGAIAREMGLPERQIEQIELAALLHDIGKIGVEDRILMKPSRLEPDERTLMQRHSIYGAAILEPSVALRPLVPLVRHHHESYDGSGYPDGLKGDEIPLGSRLIIVADAYEAMTSDRIYRKAIGHDRAMEQLHRYTGIQFDPKVVRALEGVWQRRGPAAFEQSDLPPIEYETLAELRHRLAQQPVPTDAIHAG
jgi:putative nucleotidyltransferase with HDIG domain